MAQHVEISIIDDLTGEPADETVAFGIDGVTYEIDLTSDNAAELRSTLDPFIQHGRRIGGRKRGSVNPDRLSRNQARACRAWAAANGINVNPRGRIPANVVDRWRKANAA